ncbi:MAG: polysaccharide deacetylase family protein [Burkholderiales bacterium]|nr:polysaccharide deacetylase family protein [Burkholderiales bacterium]
MRRASSRSVPAAALAALLAAAPAAASECRGTLYLTLDTSVMTQAENVARILARHQVKATFFLANEPTYRGDHSLDTSWGDYWRARVAEGHAFGTHTWDHGYFRGDLPGRKVRYVHGSRVRELDAEGVCAELRRVDTRFRELTGRGLDPLWRAPGGRTTPNALAAGEACGYTHVRWSDAGFLGDELPSDKYPNDALLEQALRRLRDGDVMMMHLGIRSRKEAFAPMLDPLLAGLKRRGFCFATLAERPR